MLYYTETGQGEPLILNGKFLDSSCKFVVLQRVSRNELLVSGPRIAQEQGFDNFLFRRFKCG